MGASASANAPHRPTAWRLILAAPILWILSQLPADDQAAVRIPSLPQPAGDKQAARPDLIAVAPPPFSDGAFPCSECHTPEDEVNTAPHPVDFHDNVVFTHDAANRWCLDCHDVKNRDKLHLADGRLIGFEESYRLCGQCHGTHLRDWKAGEHGKRTGSWSGQKQYLLCAHCHDPHSPAIKPLEPMPAPIRPEDLR